LGSSGLDAVLFLSPTYMIDPVAFHVDIPRHSCSLSYRLSDRPPQRYHHLCLFLFLPYLCPFNDSWLVSLASSDELTGIPLRRTSICYLLLLCLFVCLFHFHLCVCICKTLSVLRSVIPISSYSLSSHSLTLLFFSLLVGDQLELGSLASFRTGWAGCVWMCACT
jgi:hypothetical protein